MNDLKGSWTKTQKCPHNGISLVGCSACWEIIINKARREGFKEGLVKAIELSDKLETSMNTAFDEWRAFKGFRNSLREILEESKSTDTI